MAIVVGSCACLWLNAAMRWSVYEKMGFYFTMILEKCCSEILVVLVSSLVGSLLQCTVKNETAAAWCFAPDISGLVCC
jgi:hypothetical protein